MPIADVAARVELARALTAISIRAARAIRDAGGAGGVRIKADGSPVTAADEIAEAAIRAELESLAPSIPVVSEEAAEHDPPKVSGTTYFLVDPLDGTREFIAGRDEYAINIAVMNGETPILGVIAAPALGLVWRGVVGHGAERIALAADNQTVSAIRTRRRPQDEVVVVVSRSHLEARTRDYVEALSGAKQVAFGSALKFCRLAEGAADLYPRLAPTRDWDVAAGHAIIVAAGGDVRTPDGAAIRYGTAERLIPGFIARGDPSTPA